MLNKTLKGSSRARLKCALHKKNVIVEYSTRNTYVSRSDTYLQRLSFELLFSNFL